MKAGSTWHRALTRPLRHRWSTFAVILFFGVTSLVYVQFAPVRGATVGAVDITTRHTSPYEEDAERSVRARNTHQTDQTDTIAMVASFWRDLANGEIRTWESRLGTGVPVGGVSYTRVWSPLFWSGAIVPVQVVSSYAAWLSLWVAQLGAWALARNLGVGNVGAVFTGVAYGFSGPVTALLLRIHETAFAPWVLSAVHRVMTTRDSHVLRNVSVLVIAVAATWLGGFPAAALFILYAAAVVAVGTGVITARRNPKRLAARLWSSLVGVVCGSLLVAPLLLPSFEFLSNSESLERSYTSSHSAGLALFGNSVSGRILGTYTERTWWWPDPGYSHPVEASITVGTVALLLLAAGAISRNCCPSRGPTRLIGRVYLPIGVVVFIGTFLGGPILATLQLLPFVGSNSFGRSRFLLSLALALAAGNVLDGLVRRGPDSGRTDRVFRVLCLLFVVLSLASAILVITMATDEGRLSVAASNLILPGACAAISVAIIAAISRLRAYPDKRRVAFGAVLVLLLTVELQWGSWGFTPVVPADEGFYPEHASFQVMRPELSTGLWRFAGTDLNVIRPNSAAVLDLYDLRVSNPSYQGYRALMRAIDGDVFSRARLRTWFTNDLDPSSPGLDRSAVRFLVAPGERGVLEASPAERLAVTARAIRVGERDTPARGLRLEFDELSCRTGFLTVLTDRQTVAREPLWLFDEESIDIPLPDIQGPTVLSLQTGDCEIELPSSVVVLRAAPETQLRSLWTVGAVIYERLTPHPRIELASSILGVRDVDERMELLMSPDYRDIVILDADMSLTQLEGGQIKLIEDTGDSLIVEVKSIGEGILVVRDANAPGWRAEVNGEPVEIISADHAYRAIEVPGGRSIVTMRYIPDSRIVGFWLAGGGITVLLGALFIGTRRAERALSPDADPSDS